jgi:thiamine kinase-like enzyme
LNTPPQTPPYDRPVNVHADAEAIVQRLWPGRQASVEVLGGGLTNHNFKVTLEGGEAYAIRIAGQGTDLLGIDRRVEHEASLMASAAGVGPEVVAFVDECLVTRFVEGKIVPVEQMRTPDTLHRVAQALTAIHGSPPIGGRFDAFEVVERYRDTAVAHGGSVPARYEQALAVAHRIARAHGPVTERPCHNDLLNANFIDDGSRLRIVDWEYAGMGDVYFDLANFSINHGLDEGQSRFLLEAYFGEVRDEDERSLARMRYMSDFREAMWGVVQAAVSELDVDFDAYASEHFERLARTATSDSFRRSIS